MVHGRHLPVERVYAWRRWVSRAEWGLLFLRGVQTVPARRQDLMTLPVGARPATDRFYHQARIILDFGLCLLLHPDRWQRPV